jgi:hypothetical protein
MSKVIIGIHGLGNKPRKELLADWWKLSILEGLKKIDSNIKLPDFEMVYWADILYDEPLKYSVKDVENPYYLDEKYIPANEENSQEEHPYRMKFIKYIGQKLNGLLLNKDMTLNYSTLTDAIVSKYFKDLAIYYNVPVNGSESENSTAKDKIRERLVNVIKKYNRKDIFLIAHSMGSIISYDVLNFILPEIKIKTLATIGSPLGLPIVVSRIVSEQKLKLNGNSVLTTPPGVVKNWYNFSDVMDNVAFNFKLADDFSENTRGIKPIDYIVTNNYSYNGNPNPHKSFGYLRTPEFAKIIYEFISEKHIGAVALIKTRIAEFIEHLKNRSD